MSEAKPLYSFVVTRKDDMRLYGRLNCKAKHVVLLDSGTLFKNALRCLECEKEKSK